MTDEMLTVAEENRKKSGLTNVEFLRGEIKNIRSRIARSTWIISNCVINLSGDKDRVFKEAFRVLKPGGRFAVSDVVVRGQVPDVIRNSMELWVGCAWPVRLATTRATSAKSGRMPVLRASTSKRRACTQSPTRGRSSPAKV